MAQWIPLEHTSLMPSLGCVIAAGDETLLARVPRSERPDEKPCPHTCTASDSDDDAFVWEEEF